MKIDFNGIIDLEIPGDDELATVYDKVKATMQKEDTFDLMEAIKERTEKMEAQEGATGTFASWNLIDKITWNSARRIAWALLPRQGQYLRQS